MQKITNSVDGILGFIKNWGGKRKMIPRFHQHVCGKEGVRERKKDGDRQADRKKDS